jgi:hypothetical protein
MLAGSRDLAVLDEASRLLAQAKSLDEVKDIRDKAEAARSYIRAAKLGLVLQNRAAEVKLRAERKAGGLLRSLKLRGGDRRSKLPEATLKSSLDELGISKKQSMLWQRVSSISDRDFDAYLCSATRLGREITSTGLIRQAFKPDGKRQKGSQNVLPAIQYDSNLNISEIADELLNHCQLLTAVLRPICEEQQDELERAEKRIINRLLKEMPELIRQLECISLRNST